MISGNSHLKYATALLRATSENESAVAVVGSATQVLKDLEHLAKLFKNEEFKNMIKEISYLDKQHLRKILEHVFKDKVNVITFNLLVLLAEAKKLMLIPKIEDAYSRIYHESKGMHEVTIKSARKLDKDMEEKIVKSLEGKHKKSVYVKFEENPNLIGGFQVFERGFLTDYSVQNYLNVMRKSLMSVGE